MTGVDDQIGMLRDLRAVRRFTEDEVPGHAVADLLEVARWTGSSQNRQPWELILVRDRETLRALSEADGSPGTRHLAGAALAVVPVLAGPSAVFDEGRLCERIMLAAAVHGLGSSIAGFRGDALGAKRVLGIPEERTLRTAISIGYPASAGARLVSRERDVDTRLPLGAIPVGRRPLAELLHVERYGTRGRTGLTRVDNRRMARDGQASGSLQDIVYGYMPAQVLRVAAALGIADEIAAGRRSTAELARATASHEPSLRRVMRALTCLGVVVEPEPDLYELTADGQQLRSDVPDSIRAAVLLFTSDEMWRSWGQLEYGVRSGTIAWDHAVGMSVFEFMDRHPEQAGTFNAAMADRTRTVAPRIAASYDFTRFDTLVDLGGGDGTLMAAILAAAPALRGVLFDQPAGVASAAETLRAAGVADRCEVVSGDFFVAVPKDADAYLLKSVIHNWDDDRAATILRNCRAAMPGDGTLLVIERVLPQRIESSPMARRVVLSDINMLVNTHGRERTEREFRSLFSRAGFELTEAVATSQEPVGYQVLAGRPV